MLEDIHTTPEDRRTTNVMLAIGAVSFGAITALDALVSHAPLAAAVGAALGIGGAAALAALRRVPAPARA
ncbi:MAG TPA: hypothetical protein VE913_07220 [Longimicrobium sp.]|nr:hypothetical protein [Longimicrobium sp.]